MADFTNMLAGQAIIQILGDNQKLKKTLDEATDNVDKFAIAMTQIGSRIAVIGRAMVDPFIKATEVFRGFDDQMRRVQAVTGSSGDAFEALTAQAKELGATTSFTASQVAAGMTSLGMMGFSTDEIADAIPQVMALSKATGTELAEAATIASNQLRVFGMGANETNTAADILAFTANNSAQTLTDLGEALKMAGPFAKTAGQTLQQTSAALGVLANMGIRGSLAGTALAKSYKQLAKTEVQSYLQSLGVMTVDANGNLRDMAQIFAEIGRAISGLGNAEQIQAMEKIFDARGALGGGVLSVNAKGINDFLKGLKNSSGYATEAMQGMASGIGGALDNLSSAFEAAKISIGEAIAVPLQHVAALISTVARAFAWLNSHFKIGAIVIATAAAGMLVLGVTLSAVGALLATAYLGWQAYNSGMLQSIATTLAHITATKAWTASMAALSSALAWCKAQLLALATNPYILGFAAIAAALGAFVYLMKSNMSAGVDSLIESTEYGVQVFDRMKQKVEATRAAANADFALLGRMSKLSESAELSAEQISAVNDAIERLAELGFEGIGTLDALTGKFILAADAANLMAQRLAEIEAKTLKTVIAQRTQSLQDLEEQMIEETGPYRWKWGGEQAYYRLQDKFDVLMKEQVNDVQRLNDLLNPSNAGAEAARMAALTQMLDKLKTENKQLQDSLDEIEETRRQFANLTELQIATESEKQESGWEVRVKMLNTALAETNSLLDARRDKLLQERDAAAGLLDIEKDLAKREQKRLTGADKKIEDTYLDFLRDSNGGAYSSALSNLTNALNSSLSQVSQQLADYQRSIIGYGSEGGLTVTSAEKQQLQALQDLYQLTQDRLDEITARQDEYIINSRDLQKELSSAAGGSFSNRELSHQLQNTKPAEETAKNTKACADYLRTLSNRSSSPVYGLVFKR